MIMGKMRREIYVLTGQEAPDSSYNLALSASIVQKAELNWITLYPFII